MKTRVQETLVAKDREIAQLKNLREKDREIGKLIERRDALERELNFLSDKIDEIEQDRQSFYDAQSALIEQKDERIAALQAKVQNLQSELDRARSKIVDVAKYEGYIKRLVQPVSLSEVKAAYPGFEVAATPSHFQLLDEYGIVWLLSKNTRLRRNTGAVTNFFERTTFKALLEDQTFGDNFPANIKSDINTYFVQSRFPRAFCLCHPRIATDVVAVFLVERTPQLNEWRKAHHTDILMDVGYGKNASLQLIYVVFPFPGTNPDLCLLPDEIGEDYVEDDLEVMQGEYASALREACYTHYMATYFPEH